METNLETTEVAQKHSLKYAFGKLMIGTAVGYVATKLAEHAFDAAVVWYQTRSTETTE